MPGYTAEDCLELFDLMGLRVEDEREEVVYDRWEEIYERETDFLSAAWEMYANTIPIYSGRGEPSLRAMFAKRDSEFADELESLLPSAESAVHVSNDDVVSLLG